MMDLIHRINGNIRHTSRLKQLEKICLLLNIPIIYPPPPQACGGREAIAIDKGWFAGFFDADGTITYYIKGKYPQLTISVTNKLQVDVISFPPQACGGRRYFWW